MATNNTIPWCPPGRQLARYAKLLSVEVPAEQLHLSKSGYLGLLAFRLEDMLERESAPQAAAKKAAKLLMDAGLLDDPSPHDHPPAAAALDLVMNNLAFRKQLDRLGVFAPNGRDWTVSDESGEAKRALKETTLQEWLALATAQLGE